MNQLSKKTLLQAARGERGARTPVWFLRQAGRYLPEYREVRQNFDFVELCSTPDKAAEVTLQPLKRFDLDAAIIFSDILIPCIALGQKLTFDKGHGPVLAEPVRDAATLKKLSVPSNVQSKVGYVGDAIRKAKDGLQDHQTMIGFAGAPFTVASYMIEGQGSKNYTEIKKLVYKSPEIFAETLAMVTQITKSYLEMQIDAGAEYLMLFDTWANQLPAHFYRKMVFPFVKEIVDHIKSLGVPIAYFPGQGLNMITELEGLNLDVLHIDWRVRLSTAQREMKRIGLNVTTQGNIDPQLFLANKDVIQEEVFNILNQSKDSRAHIFNVGHGLLPFTPIEGIQNAVEAVRLFDSKK